MHSARIALGRLAVAIPEERTPLGALGAELVYLELVELVDGYDRRAEGVAQQAWCLLRLLRPHCRNGVAREALGALVRYFDPGVQ